MSVRIAIDCMGGDHGIAVTVPPALHFAAEFPEASLLLVGQNRRFSGAEPRFELSWKDATEELHTLLLDSLKKRVRSDA